MSSVYYYYYSVICKDHEKMDFFYCSLLDIWSELTGRSEAAASSQLPLLMASIPLSVSMQMSSRWLLSPVVSPAVVFTLKCSVKETQSASQFAPQWPDDERQQNEASCCIKPFLPAPVNEVQNNRDSHNITCKKKEGFLCVRACMFPTQTQRT